MSWCVRSYTDTLKELSPRCSGQRDHLEKKLLQLFPPAQKELIISPCVVTDNKGSVLLWYLPGLLSPKRRVCFGTFMDRILIDRSKDDIWKTLEIIEGLLKIKRRSSSWQVNETYFKLASDCKYKPGTMSFALAWFQQAMAVSGLRIILTVVYVVG